MNPVRPVGPGPTDDRPRRPRVLLYTDAQTVGGAEISVRELLDPLGAEADIDLVGVSQTVLVAMASGRAGTPTHQLPVVASKRDVSAIWQHLELFRSLRHRLDVVHLNMRTPWSCQYGLVAALAARIPVVAVHHAVLEPANRSQALMMRLLSRKVRRSVAVSSWTAKAVAGLWRISEDRWEVIPNGVRAADSPAPELVGRTVGGRPERIGAIGRLSPEKGFDILLRALDLAPGLNLELVGEGPDGPRLEQLAAELGLTERVQFVGWDPEPMARLAGWSAVVVPSRSESFGLVAVEAMLVGVPVIAAAIGGLPEVITDGETGLLVPPENPSAIANALMSVLADDALRLRIIRRASEVARVRYSPQLMAPRYLDLYRRVGSARS